MLPVTALRATIIAASTFLMAVPVTADAQAFGSGQVRLAQGLRNDPSAPILPSAPTPAQAQTQEPLALEGADLPEDGTGTTTEGEASEAEASAADGQGETAAPPAATQSQSEQVEAPATEPEAEQVQAPSTPEPARQTAPRTPQPRRIAVTNPPIPRQKPAGAADETPRAEGSGPEEPVEAAAEVEAPAFAGTSTEGLDLGSDVMGPMLDGDPLQSLPEAGPKPDYVLDLAAILTEGGEPVPSGVVWRVFRAQPAIDGSFELVEESTEPRPDFLLPADDYIVHVAYGRADTAKRISLKEGPLNQDIVLDAGGLRVTCIDAMNDDLGSEELIVSIYSSEQDEYGQRRLIVEDAAQSRILRLNPGTYHVVSRWGDANAVIRADVLVKPGELTDATISHRAAAVTLKLVNEPGGEALANTNWSILSPGGDVVKESFGAFPTHVLAAGEYSVVARHDGRLYNRDFQVTPGLDGEVELVAE